MSIVIRLAKTGRKGEARFRLVVCEKRSRRDGKPLENLGWYQKGVEKITQEVNKERYKYWLTKGAKPSRTVESLMKV